MSTVRLYVEGAPSTPPASEVRIYPELDGGVVMLKMKRADGTVVTLGGISSPITIAQGGTGLAALGASPNQVLGSNAANTALEYKTVAGTANQVTVAHGVGTVTLGTPQNIHAAASPTFAGATLSGMSTGVVHSSVSGVLSSSQIVDADVSVSAAISTAKLTVTTLPSPSRGVIASGETLETALMKLQYSQALQTRVISEDMTIPTGWVLLRGSETDLTASLTLEGDATVEMN